MSPRHLVRWLTNGAMIVAAVLAVPEWQVVPADWLPVLAVMAAITNQFLSVLRVLGAK